jgi:hypothetical protein
MVMLVTGVELKTTSELPCGQCERQHNLYMILVFYVEMPCCSGGADFFSDTKTKAMFLGGSWPAKKCRL